jgi:putative membrane protein
LILRPDDAAQIDEGGNHVQRISLDGSGGWVLMALFWIAVVALIGWLIVRLTATAADGPGAADRRFETPREILDRRLARGEVDQETYDQLREHLDPRPLAGRG